MPVPASRLFMSLLDRDKSATLFCSSALTVASSSLTDCNSSLDVSSSSLVDCNSSLTDCISSLEDLSSSLVVASSSLAAWRKSSLARNCCVSAATRASASGWGPSVAAMASGVAGSAGSGPKGGASSRMTRYRGVSGVAAPVASGRMVRLTIVKSPLVLTRRPGQRTVSFVPALDDGVIDQPGNRTQDLSGQRVKHGSHVV